MRKLSLLFLLIAGIMIGFTACNDDEETFFDRPDVAPPTTDPAVQVGSSTTFNVVIDAPAGIASVEASASSGTVTVDNANDLVGETTGTANLTYQAPAQAGIYRVTVTVTDEQVPAKSQELRIPVEVTPEPQAELVDVYPSLTGVGTTTWTSDKIYILRGFIFVNDGQTLTIQPGTVIKGQPGQGAGASALIVARGGMIDAQGTAENPIIFTGLADNLEGSLPDDANSQWGGIIVLGNAATNNNDTGGERNIEGIPTEEARGSYGPNESAGFALDNADNSGTMSYVSIRHGGSLIGSDNEINGLTLGAVGSGTTIENVEVFSNLDDGIEFFGGNVNVSGIVLAYSGDDGIDIDEGYSGGIQKGIVWHTSQTIESDDPSGGEWDGGDDVNEPVMPYASSVIANITFMYDDNGENDLAFAIRWRDNNSTSLHNSIVVGHDAPFWLEFRNDKVADGGPQSSWHRWEAGDLNITKNLFYNINGSNDVATMWDLGGIDDAAQEEADFETYITNNNAVVDPSFGTGATKFTPSATEATADLATLPDGFGFMDLQYKGGVDPAASQPFFANWTKTWDVIQ